MIEFRVDRHLQSTNISSASLSHFLLSYLISLVYCLQRASKRKINPCAQQIERITNAMEAADYNIRPLYCYVKDLEECYKRADVEDRKKGKASTSFYLSKYLDQQKFKQK